MSTSGISKAQWRKDAPSLLVCFCAIAFIPISIYLLRPRPLSAATPGALIALAREQTAEESLTILSQHHAAWNPEPPESRWQNIAQNLYDSDKDLEEEEVNGVLQACKSALESHGWPLYVKRGMLDGQSVWIAATGSGFSTPAYICPPSLSDLHRDKLESAKSGQTIVIVTTQFPHRVLTH